MNEKSEYKPTFKAMVDTWEISYSKSTSRGIQMKPSQNPRNLATNLGTLAGYGLCSEKDGFNGFLKVHPDSWSPKLIPKTRSLKFLVLLVRLTLPVPFSL